MVDTRTKAQRRRIMQAVKGRNTAPEWTVRRLLHTAGYRYRLHVRSLPGTPDIVFPIRKKAVLVHGCFWHGHRCRIGQLPKTRIDYWENKIATNSVRDSKKIGELEMLGWKVLVVWQCEIKDLPKMASRLQKFLGKPRKTIELREVQG